LNDLDPSELPSRLEEFASTWRHALQFTPPRASLLAADDLLDRMSASMLKEPTHVPRPDTKLSLLRRARVSLTDHIRTNLVAADDTLGDVVDDLVHVRATVSGRMEPHPVDLAIRNGHTIVGVQAVAFPKEPSARTRKDVSATAWLLKDVQESAEAPTMAVLVAPPADSQRDDYRHAKDLFEGLDAEVVTASQLEPWAMRTAEAVAIQLAANG